MHVTYLMNDVDVTVEAKAYIEKKIAAVAKLLARSERAEVEVGQDKRGLYRVEVMVHEPGQQYRAVEEEAESIMAGIDAVEVKLQEQIRDAHDKRRALERRGARSFKKKATIDDAARF